MQFSEHWLRTLADPKLSSEELAHLLTMSGLEVESRDPVAPLFSGVVVAEILSVARHPNADRLSVCEVNAGAGSVLKIVCGAPNVVAGMKVPCARIGALLPGDTSDTPFLIKAAKMRGEESQGMLCSARELGLSEDHGGLLVLDCNAQVGIDVRELLDLDDKIFNLKLTPNRADCLSLLGVAREVVALTGAPLKAPDIGAVTATSAKAFRQYRLPWLWTLHRPGYPECQRESQDARLDEDPPGTRGAALDIRSGGCHQLRHARIGPSTACL